MTPTSQTIDRRYQVFVSSTYEDLSAERAAVMQGRQLNGTGLINK